MNQFESLRFSRDFINIKYFRLFVCCVILKQNISLGYHYKMSCTQCNQISKYKCPNCREPYCSVECYKEHKLSPCSPPFKPPEEIVDKKESIEYEYPTEDTVPLESLKLLENSTELRKCLENHHVREILEMLDKAPHPDDLIQDYMQETIFTEFVDACLKVVQTQDKIISTLPYTN